MFQTSAYFLFKNCNPPEKSHPPLSQQSPSKNWDPIKPLFFENLVGGSTLTHHTPTPQQKWGRCTLLYNSIYISTYLCIYVSQQYICIWVYICKTSQWVWSEYLSFSCLSPILVKNIRFNLRVSSKRKVCNKPNTSRRRYHGYQNFGF